jgi:hypothetical protein
MSLFALAILVTCMAMGVHHYWHRDARDRGEREPTRQFLLWAARGLLAPMLVWTFFNCGWLVSPLIPHISQAQSAGKLASAFIPITAGVLFVVGSWWAAVTLGWIAVNVFMRSDHRGELLATAAIWLVGVVFVGAIILLLSGGFGLGFALALCFGTVVHATMPLAPVKLPPTYSKALAKIAFDKFNDAEWEIIHQLEKAENDFDGWMLLADLYATHFRDLSSAERTICELCDDPHTNEAQVAIALNRLADWHLKLDDNPVNARWALEKICERLPNTHMERMARLRIDHLPATREEFIHQKAGRTLRIPPSPEIPQVMPRRSAEGAVPKPPTTISLATPSVVVPSDPQQVALAEANQCVEQLRLNPDDIPTRERFARLLAEALGQPDTALQQIELLLAMPTDSDQRAAWMALQAEWHIRLRQDKAAGFALLQRIINEFPQSHAAFEAQRRLYLMQVETAVRQRKRPSATKA